MFNQREKQRLTVGEIAELKKQGLTDEEIEEIEMSWRSVEEIEALWRSGSLYEMEMAITESVGRDDVPISLIKEGLLCGEPMISRSAADACKGRADEISMSEIEDWMKSGDISPAIAAIYACENKENALPILEQGLKSKFGEIRQAAISVCEKMDLPASM